MQYRFVGPSEAPLLAKLSQQLIEDEGHWLQLSAEQLETRLRGWLGREHRTVLFQIDDEIVAYALYRPDEWGGICVRQFFVQRGYRRQGIGRLAFRLLRDKVWPTGCRTIADVLVDNEAAHKFCQAMGFRGFAVTLEYGRQPAS